METKDLEVTVYYPAMPDGQRVSIFMYHVWKKLKDLITECMQVVEEKLKFDIIQKTSHWSRNNRCRILRDALKEKLSDSSNTIRWVQGHDCFLTFFHWLGYEFIYKVDNSDKKIELISCERLTFLDYGHIF